MKQKNIILILDNIRSVHNVGSIFRTADCFGVSKIYLCGTTPAPIDRFGRSRSDLAKVALGAQQTVAWEYVPNTVELVQSLKSPDVLVCALEQSQNSVLISELVVPDNITDIVVVVGYEVVGVSDMVLAIVDKVLEIPQFGTKESLNVSVATGIALYQVRML